MTDRESDYLENIERHENNLVHFYSNYEIQICDERMILMKL